MKCLSLLECSSYYQYLWIYIVILIQFFYKQEFFFISRNDLERQYLEMLQFNINVGSSVYAKYYFDLRALADANDLSFPLEPLSKDRALKLEVVYRSYKCFFGYMRRKASVLRKMLEGNINNLFKNPKMLIFSEGIEFLIACVKNV